MTRPRFLLPFLSLLALAGCLHSTPPRVFAEPVATVAPPAPVHAPADPEACPAAAPYLPGDAPPWVDSSGAVTCRGVVVTEEQLTRLMARDAEADFWRRSYEVQVSWREEDRRVCEDEAAARWTAARDMSTALKRQRAATVGGVLGALVVGVAVGAVVP